MGDVSARLGGLPEQPVNHEFVDAVCELVDAVLAEHCTPVCTEGRLDEQLTVSCVLDVLREIRTAEELSSLHGWANARVSAVATHLNDGGEALAQIVRRRR